MTILEFLLLLLIAGLAGSIDQALIGFNALAAWSRLSRDLSGRLSGTG
ncbi:MAG: hypothetical protein R6U51_03810 [Anaerolineales bacterium]